LKGKVAPEGGLARCGGRQEKGGIRFGQKGVAAALIWRGKLPNPECWIRGGELRGKRETVKRNEVRSGRKTKINPHIQEEKEKGEGEGLSCH